jgi:hypothetical protein
MTFDDLKDLERRGDYLGLIRLVREKIADSKRALTEPSVKAWLGRRWRNLFLQEAVNDAAALEVARKKKVIGKDKRPAAQKIAERFLRGAGIDEWRHEMPEAQFSEIRNVTFLFAPGLLNGMLPVRAFQTPLPALVAKTGWNVLRADTHPFRSCDANTEDLLQALDTGRGLNAKGELIESSAESKPKDVFVLGYSKGVPDTLTLLAKYPELKGRIRCVFSWAGAAGGSHLADDIVESVKNLELDKLPNAIDMVLNLFAPNMRVRGTLRRMDEYDIKGAALNLTTHFRRAFLDEHAAAIDALDIPMFNLMGNTSLLEVPYFQMQGFNTIAKYDANNDMQVTLDQARIPIPMATDLAVLRGHHWDLSYDPFPKSQRFGSPNLSHPFPREAALTAIFKFAAELGLID